MRVDHVHHVVDGALELKNGGGFGENFCGQRSDNVNAEDFAPFFVRDDFDEAAVRAEDGRFAVANEGEFPGFDGVARLPGLFFGEADRTDLRLAVGGVRNARLYDRMRRFTRDVRDRNDVADGIEARFIGLHELVYRHKSAVELGPRFFEAAIFGHGLPTDGQEKFFSLEALRLAVLVFEGDGDALGVFLDALDGAVREDMDAALLKGLVELGGDFLVLDRYDAGQGLKNRDLGAEGVEDGGKLNANRPGADDDECFRDFRQVEDGAVGENLLVVRLDSGESLGFRTAHEKNATGFDGGCLAGLFDAHLARAVVLAPALNPFDLVFLEEEFDSLGMLGDDLALACKDICPVDLQAGDFEAEFRGIFEVVVDIGVMKQDFGRNAANMQTGAAEIGILLDDNGLQPQLAGANGRNIAARPTANNRNIIIRHAQSPFSKTEASAHGPNWVPVISTPYRRPGQTSLDADQ